jgi:hypothetical protein
LGVCPPAADSENATPNFNGNSLPASSTNQVKFGTSGCAAQRVFDAKFIFKKQQLLCSKNIEEPKPSSVYHAKNAARVKKPIAAFHPEHSFCEHCLCSLVL